MIVVDKDYHDYNYFYSNYKEKKKVHPNWKPFPSHFHFHCKNSKTEVRDLRSKPALAPSV